MTVSQEQTEQVIDCFRQAAACNSETAGRRGCLVELGPGDADDVMVTADLHGQRLNFHELCRRADLAHNPGRHLVMQEVCHGGPSYPHDGGCMSHLLLEDIAQLKVDFPDRFHFLLSNHEMAELTDFPISKNRRMLNLTFRCGLQMMYGSRADDVRDAYCEFLGSCPLALRMSNGVLLCHSAPERVDETGFDVAIFDRELTLTDLEPGGAAFSLVWGRDFRPENADAFARLVDVEVLIHGHEPCRDGFATPNHRQIILDCSNHRAAYLIIPADRPVSQAELVALIQRIHRAR